LFIISVVRSVKSFDRFVIFFVRLSIIGRDTKPFLLIKKALRHIIKRIV
jgi:hypothetical protein